MLRLPAARSSAHSLMRRPPPARGLAFSPQHALLPRFKTAADMYAHMRGLTASGGGGEFTVRNYLGVIEDLSSPEAALVETELFPRGALEFYTKQRRAFQSTRSKAAEHGDAALWVALCGRLSGESAA